MTRAYLNAYEQLPAADLLARYDADAAELHVLMLGAGAVDRFADRVNTREWDGYRYILTLPSGSLWRVGGVSAVTGSIMTRFDDVAEGQRYASSRWGMGANPINGKFNLHSAMPRANVEQLVKVLTRIQPEPVNVEPSLNPARDAMFDQIHAFHPVTGKLHSSSPAYPWFEDTMRRQGFRVVRVPAAEWRASKASPCPQSAAAVSPVQDVENVPPPLPLTSATPAVPSSPSPLAAEPLPALPTPPTAQPTLFDPMEVLR